jgi:hypothetical protein
MRASGSPIPCHHEIGSLTLEIGGELRKSSNASPTVAFPKLSMSEKKWSLSSGYCKKDKYVVSMLTTIEKHTDNDGASSSVGL